MNERKKRSPIWKIDVDQLKQIVKKSNSLTEILKHFYLDNKGGNFKTLKARLNHDKIDFTHIKLGLNSNKGRKFYGQGQPLEEILVKNSTYRSRRVLKKRLICASLIDNICAKCGLGPEWCGENLSLQLDHINGISNDNRLENLRILCPNCHTQTPTFAGRRLKKSRPSDSNPNWRNKEKPKSRKVERPSKEKLQHLINNNSWVSIGKMYGVSDNAIRKWARRYNII